MGAKGEAVRVASGGAEDVLPGGLRVDGERSGGVAGVDLVDVVGPVGLEPVWVESDGGVGGEDA